MLPPSWLKKLWGIPDLRDRVINAAINELDCWDDSKNEDSNNGGLNRTSRINWAVAIESFPKTRINLYLVTSISDDFKKSVYKISDDLLSKKILDGQKNEFVLTKLIIIYIFYELSKFSSFYKFFIFFIF